MTLQSLLAQIALGEASTRQFKADVKNPRVGLGAFHGRTPTRIDGQGLLCAAPHGGGSCLI